jgi:hypothetical protein
VLIDAGSVFSVDQNQTERNISVVPNPSAGKFIVESAINAVSIAVFDISGREVYSTSANGRISSIELIDQPDGVYFMSIIFDDGTMGNTRFIKSASN